MNALLSAQPLHGASYLPGAHHPHCDRHDHHLVWIGSRPLCLGCTCLYSGVLLGGAASIILSLHQLEFTQWSILYLLLVVPTAIQPFAQVKWFKIGARFALGLAAGSYFPTGAFFVEPPVPRPLFLLSLPVAFAAVLLGLLRLRNAYANDPCRNCPLGVFPTCEWNLPRLLASNGEPHFREALAIRDAAQQGAAAGEPQRVPIDLW